MLGGIILTLLSFGWYFESTKNISVSSMMGGAGNPNIFQIIGIIGGIILFFIGYFKTN